MCESAWYCDDYYDGIFATPADLRRANCMLEYDWSDPFGCGRSWPCNPWNRGRGCGCGGCGCF